MSEWSEACAARRGKARRRQSRRVVSVAALAVAAPLGAGMGWAVSGPTPARARSATVVAGPVRATLPAAWRQGRGKPPAKIAGRSLIAGATLAYPQLGTARLDFGLVRRGTRDPAPEDLVSGQRPAAARIGSLDGFRFADVAGPGGTQDAVFAVATSAGYVVFRCRAAMADLATFAPVCRGLISRVSISGAKVESPGPNTSYARLLNDGLASLKHARHAATAGLAHRSMADRQAAASAITRAYGAFDRALATRTPRFLDRARSTALQTGLRHAAEAYEDLATAARRHDRHAYTLAVAAVRAQERSVGQALDDLRAGGYEPPSGAPR